MKSLISKRSVRRLVPVTKQNTNIQSKRALSLKLILHNISFQGLDSLQNISKEYTIFRWLFKYYNASFHYCYMLNVRKSNVLQRWFDAINCLTASTNKPREGFRININSAVGIKTVLWTWLIQLNVHCRWDLCNPQSWYPLFMAQGRLPKHSTDLQPRL